MTSLALCHSALHNLTIPYIYSRFDIVWPDSTVNSEQRSGVDALTYGLATLVMGEEIFGESQWQRDQARQLRQTQTPSSAQQRQSSDPFPIPKRRRGNYFAKYTKKFSLGNGPVEWVQDYLITKEGGKMLGTLVAVAVARMRNLETFVWDMPTGVLRDVWLALSSLADRDDGQDCRLERLWIRWHDNSGADLTVPPPPMPISNLPPPPPHAHNASGVGAAQAPIVVPVPHSAAALAAIDRVEHPTFSVIPALKSLSVLDIDELPYLDEMAILIGRSQNKLRELRVGIAKNAYEAEREWVIPWEGTGTQQVDHSTLRTAASKIGDKRLGGILGILVGRVYNMRHNTESQEANQAPIAVDRVWEHGPSVTKSEVNLPHASGVDGRELDASPGAPLADNSVQNQTPAAIYLRERALESERREREKNLGPLLNTKLKLETLELERVPMSVPVMLQAFDWSKLTALTLLNCSGHETLWRTLRREFAPRGPQHSRGSPTKTHSRLEYRLNLKKIHTNTVSGPLILFIKETLAPNSLEVLFLQEDRSYHSNVNNNAIFRGALKRHRASLKKVMIDSSEKGNGDRAPTSTRWRRWMLNREIITFVTSGRMCNLRELAFCIDYLDWVRTLDFLSVSNLLTEHSTFSSNASPKSLPSAPSTSRTLPTTHTAITLIRASLLCKSSTSSRCVPRSKSATWASKTSALRCSRTRLSPHRTTGTTTTTAPTTANTTQQALRACPMVLVEPASASRTTKMMSRLASRTKKRRMQQRQRLSWTRKTSTKKRKMTMMTRMKTTTAQAVVGREQQEGVAGVTSTPTVPRAEEE